MDCIFQLEQDTVPSSFSSGCVHMTGGIATHDAIVWGSGKEEQARRKAANDPLLKVCACKTCH